MLNKYICALRRNIKPIFWNCHHHFKQQIKWKQRCEIWWHTYNKQIQLMKRQRPLSFNICISCITLPHNMWSSVWTCKLFIRLLMNEMTTYSFRVNMKKKKKKNNNININNQSRTESIWTMVTWAVQQAKTNDKSVYHTLNAEWLYIITFIAYNNSSVSCCCFLFLIIMHCMQVDMFQFVLYCASFKRW